MKRIQNWLDQHGYKYIVLRDVIPGKVTLSTGRPLSAPVGALRYVEIGMTGPETLNDSSLDVWAVGLRLGKGGHPQPLYEHIKKAHPENMIANTRLCRLQPFTTRYGEDEKGGFVTLVAGVVPYRGNVQEVCECITEDMPAAVCSLYPVKEKRNDS